MRHILKLCNFREKYLKVGHRTTELSCAIFVDLDRTLIKQDSTMECLRQVLKSKSVSDIIKIVISSRLNLAKIKNEVIRNSNISSIAWSYNFNLLRHLEDLRTSGRKIYLITASSTHVAKYFFENLDIFEAMFCSSDGKKLKGSAKYEKMSSKFGKDFEYYGDSIHDLRVWIFTKKAHISRENYKIKFLIRLFFPWIRINLF